MRSNTSRTGTTRTMAYPISATPKGAKLNPRAAAEALQSLNPGYVLPRSRVQTMAENLMAAGEQALAMNPIRLASPAQVEANQHAMYGAFSGMPVDDGLIAAGRIPGFGADHDVRDPEPLEGGGFTDSLKDKKNAELAAAGGGVSEAIGFGSPTVRHGPFTLAKSVRIETPVGPGHQPERPPQAQPRRIPQTADERGAGEGGTQVAQRYQKNLGKGPRDLTPKQMSTLVPMEAEWNRVFAVAKKIDPNYSPPPVLVNSGTFEGESNRLKFWIEETKKWIREQQRRDVRKEPNKPMREYRPRFRGLLEPPL